MLKIRLKSDVSIEITSPAASSKPLATVVPVKPTKIEAVLVDRAFSTTVLMAVAEAIAVDVPVGTVTFAFTMTMIYLLMRLTMLTGPGYSPTVLRRSDPNRSG